MIKNGATEGENRAVFRGLLTSSDALIFEGKEFELECPDLFGFDQTEYSLLFLNTWIPAH